MALGQELIDAASFTSVRVISGALTLGLIALPGWRDRGRTGANAWSAAMLFTYMAFFSFAYQWLGAGTGALILFGAVQLTMFIVALKNGEKFPLWSWAGLLLAASGLVYLVSPGLTAPDPLGAGLMVVAGVAWGWYSLVGRRSGDALKATATNFLYSVPLVMLVSWWFLDKLELSPAGLVLAVLSGSIASGLGYVTWYAALKGLTATRAASVQLSVPVIAALGGILILAEPVTPRLLLASAATLGGVAIVLMQDRKSVV